MVAVKGRWELSAEGLRSMNLSFAGCGFLGIYHVGVASCLREYAPHLVADKISGASAGALAACALITGCCLGECTSYTLRLATKARERALGPLHPSFNLVRYLREGLEGFLPENAHVIASGRLHVSLTRVSDRKNVLVTQFDSKDELIDALICSAFVPFYCGVLPPKFKGVRYVDGCLSDNNPILNDNTIMVSPFAGESDICPRDNSANYLSCTLANTNIQFTLGNLYRMSRVLFPPHPETLSKMCQEGFQDCLRFLQRNNLISCTRHLAIQSSIRTEKPLSLADMDDSEESMDYEEEESGSGSEDSSSICDDEDCMDCKHRRHVALVNSLPPSVLTALQAACDSVNKGLLGPLYNMRVYKVLSLMVAPWLLPMDVVVVLGQRLYEWGPYMPRDMQWFLREFVLLMKDLVGYIQKGRHRYSARLTCQFAITEEDLHRHHGHMTPKLSPSPSVSRSGSFSHPRRVNLGFSVDFKTHARSPLKCVGDLSRQVMEDATSGNLNLDEENSVNIINEDLQNLKHHHHHHHHQRHLYHSRSNSAASSRRASTELPSRPLSSSSLSSKISESTHNHSPPHPHPHHHLHPHPHHHMDVNYDTFENCLHIANQMDSLLAFYYTEEDTGLMKITEIFALDDPAGPKAPEFSPSEMAWDTYVDMERHDSVPVTPARSYEDVSSSARSYEDVSSSELCQVTL